MKVLYVDEAGCLGMLPSSTSNIQPIFASIAIAFDVEIVGDLTRDFLELKRRFFPGIHKSAHYLDDILAEVKGADIRRNIATGNRRSSRAAFGFLDHLFTLIEKHDGRILGRVWVKGIDEPFKGRSVYTFSMQDSCSTFQRYLESVNDQGFIVADSRNKPANTNVSHSIYLESSRQTATIFPAWWKCRLLDTAIITPAFK